MDSYNRVILAGNLTRDPELSYTPNDTAICRFGLAVNRKRRDRDGNMTEGVYYEIETLNGEVRHEARMEANREVALCTPELHESIEVARIALLAPPSRHSLAVSYADAGGVPVGHVVGLLEVHDSKEALASRHWLCSVRLRCALSRSGITTGSTRYRYLALSLPMTTSLGPRECLTNSSNW